MKRPWLKGFTATSFGKAGPEKNPLMSSGLSIASIDKSELERVFGEPTFDAGGAAIWDFWATREACPFTVPFGSPRIRIRFSWNNSNGLMVGSSPPINQNQAFKLVATLMHGLTEIDEDENVPRMQCLLIGDEDG